MARIAILVGFLLVLAGGGAAQERAPLLPDIPKGTGEAHAEGNSFWRKNHMEMMRHDRDLTLRMGEREIDASLKGCFDCHAVSGDHGTPVTYENEKHFCRVCHDYAAVKVDCFMCHRSTPDGVDEHAINGSDHAMLPTPEREVGAVEGYLKRLAARRGGTDG
jgi:hypothetical protein